MASKILIKHPQSGIHVTGWIGFSWTYLFCGWCVPLVRREIRVAGIHLLLTLCTCGIWQVAGAFLYNRQYMTRMLVDKGYILADTRARNDKALVELDIAPLIYPLG
ncbi:hypothetical protein [Paraburkholderia rhizosphaerae]|uniref:Uncharacterized protein n=1 Tax=Paraburkholderia rhizosphaerae TaxID=480658 RepID=A0A4V3HDT8_9BURK|nr:hypothetical protein [Paraburkholderia rhizosphaerae]TDY42314.1 hypothetical protein BX592_122123 [Paraburkholderia rhizosphaerae]